ncbi:MAG: alpha-fucosidase [Armatimonadia bacterium]|nr:alpha-fucosidase [Armatimonadia bacterium]
MDDIVRKAAHVTPSERQLQWQRLEFTCFIHFGMNTFTGQEWGDGTEDPAWFDPTELDADQWARACVDAGMREIILTAKHHDGFCLWPSEYTEHSVRNSPWRDGQGDLVREVAEACRRHGLELGIYLSPWDRHEPSYGDSPRYNEYFRNQLTELLSNYGEISEVWFDGACGEGPNGKRQEYDWESYYAVVRELQPGAVISVVGPDVRWCGNEAGRTRESEWSVIPSGVDGQAEDLGSRAVLAEAAQRGATLRWHPAQVNTSIRPGWFYHPEEDDQVKPLHHLLDIYYGSVGGNAQFLLNLPPDRRGLIHENDVARLRELDDVLRATFDEDLAAGASCTASSETPEAPATAAADGDDATFWMPREGDRDPSLVLELTDARTFDTVLLQEHIQVGQRIEELALDALVDGTWREVTRATTVGYKRLLRFDPVTTNRIRVRVLSSRLEPTLQKVGVFLSPSEAQGDGG